LKHVTLLASGGCNTLSRDMRIHLIPAATLISLEKYRGLF
jgi:hypothetical protein